MERQNKKLLKPVIFKYSMYLQVGYEFGGFV